MTCCTLRVLIGTLVQGIRPLFRRLGLGLGLGLAQGTSPWVGRLGSWVVENMFPNNYWSSRLPVGAVVVAAPGRNQGHTLYSVIKIRWGEYRYGHLDRLGHRKRKGTVCTEYFTITCIAGIGCSANHLPSIDYIARSEGTTCVPHASYTFSCGNMHKQDQKILAQKPCVLHSVISQANSNQ